MISTSVLLILPSGTQESDQCKKLHNPTKPPLNGIHRASSLLQTQNPQQQQQKHKINERKAYSASENKPVSERNVDLTLQSLCNQGHLDKALHILRGDMSSPLTTSTYLSILKECIKKKSSSGAKCVHAHITSYQIDLNQNAILGDYLVMALARCRELEDARALAESLPKLTIYSWTALISAYAEFGRGDDSLHFYRCMLDDGIHPDKYTFVGLFRACGSIRDLSQGKRLHSEARLKGYAGDVFVCNSIISMYGKCGDIKKAEEVFCMMIKRDVVSWNAMLSGYVEMEQGERALQLLRQMYKEGWDANNHTCVIALQACCIYADNEEGLLMDGNFVKPVSLSIGEGLHADAEKKGFLCDVYVGTALSSMYAKCGLLANAQEAFDELCIQDVVSWTSLISGYAKYESGESALECFERMKLKGVTPNAVTYVCSLTACGRVGETSKGEEIHAETVKKGLLYKEIAVGNALVDMYGNCGLLMKAQEVFDVLPLRDVITWNALMSGYARHEYGKEALKCFSHMQLEGVAPDVSTLVCGLKACATIGDIDKGREIHIEISRRGCLEKNVVVGSALVDMYSKCGYLRRAREVLDNLLVRDVISWNALISGYVKYECGKEAIACFEQMQDENISPDAVTFVCTLKACGSLGAIKEGREIHVEISKQGLLERDSVIGSALVDMYAKCGLLQHAQEVFDKLTVHDTVSWTALIAGYANNGHGKEALNCFNQMQSNGLSPNVVTYVCGLKACGSIGAIEKGQEIHAEVDREGLLEADVSIGNALADMYMKCGSLIKAQDVFDMLPSRDVNSWNALITGYAKFKHGVEALRCFEHMQLEGVLPDSGTFVGVLVACCHGGLVQKGQTYLEIMTEDYGISPTIEHHTCMVSLLARAGHLDMALKMAAKMQCDSPPLIWDAMLTGCEKWGNMEVGRFAFENESKWINKST